MACDMVVNHYALTPSKLDLQELYAKSSISSSLDPEASRTELVKALVKAFREEKVAGLTGSGDTERMANFIYEVDVSLGNRSHCYLLILSPWYEG